MVGNPEPVVLEVDGCFLGNVQEHVGADAGGIRGGGHVRVLGTGVALQAGASGAANAHVYVPHAAGCGCGFGDVPFDEDGARGGAFGFKDEVAHFDGTCVAGLANLEDGLRVGLVVEGFAVRHDQGPDLTGDLDVLGHLDSVGDEIGAVVKVDNLAIRRFVKDGLESGGVVRNAVTLGTSRLDTDEAGSWYRFVLWLGALNDLALAVKEWCRLCRSRKSAVDGDLGSTSSAVAGTLALGGDSRAGRVSAALTPRGDFGTTSEDTAAANVLNGGLRAAKVYIVDNEGSTRSWDIL